MRKRTAERSPHVDRETVRHFVYRLHDKAGEVIYVGRSCEVAKRLRSHHSAARNKYLTGKEWFFDVRAVSMSGPMNLDDVIAAERREVALFQPRGNVALTARDHRPFVAHTSVLDRKEADPLVESLLPVIIAASPGTPTLTCRGIAEAVALHLRGERAAS